MTTLRDLGITPASEQPAPTLRSFGVAPAAPAVNPNQFTDVAAANSMGQLRKGFTSGLYSADQNAMAADMSSLRAAGRHAEADALAQQIAASQQRAAPYAVAEPDVTKLDWNPGRIYDWATGAMGQGAASMLEPAGAAGAMGLGSRVLSAIPTGPTRFLGGALRLGAPAAAGYLNYRQNKGEFVRDAYEDPTTVANRTPQEIENAAMLHGAAAGLVDTALPGMVGERMAGKSLIKSLAKVPTPVKFAGDLLGEGVGETLQGESKRYMLGRLNPERDTSGDAAERWNDFAGGIAGAGPISGASHVASHMMNGAAHRLSVEDDLSSNDVSGKAKPKAEAPPKDLTESLVRRAKEDKTAEVEAWRNTLRGVPPEGSEDIDPFVDAQHAALLKELGTKAAKGDTVAQQHLDTLNAMSKDSPDWYDEGPRTAAADHVLGDDTNHDRLVERYSRRADNTRKFNLQGFQTVKVGDEEVAVGAPISAEDLGAGKTGGVKVAPDSPQMKALVEERRAVKQRGDLTARVMSDAVPTGAKPQLKNIAADLGREIAEFAGGGYKKPTQGDVARVLRMGQQLVYLYGRDAHDVVAKIAEPAGVAGTSLYKILNSVVTAARDSTTFRRQQAVARDEAAKQLVAVIPPRAQLTLHRAGLDLTTPEGRSSLLDHVEEFFDGESSRPATAFNATFTKDAVEQMRLIVGQRLEPRAEALPETTSKAENGSEDTAPKESDESAANAGEEDADWERKGAEKNIEKAPGTKEYYFKGREHPSLSTDGAHPFVPDAKTKNLPTLSLGPTLDEQGRVVDEGDKDHDGTPTLQRVMADAFTAYGGHNDPMSIIPSGVKPKKGEDLPVGVGPTRIRTTSAKEVMDHSGVGKQVRVQIMRSYLARMSNGKVALSRDDPTIQQIETMDRRIAKMEKATPKELTVAVGPNGAVTKENPQHAALRELKGQREEVAAQLAAKAGVDYTDGMSVSDIADAYFSERFLVVAEQMAEKDQLRLQRAEVVQMIRRGNDDLDFSAQGKADGSQAQMQADMNLIRFKSPLAVAKDGVAVVRAADLVSWVYENRNDKEKPAWNSGSAQAHSFRNALMEGIGALAADGHMEGLPWMVNAKGKTESFSKGFPPSLRLVGTTQGKMDFGKKKRVQQAAQESAYERATTTPQERYKAEASAERARQRAVSAEQNQETPDRNTNPDELIDAGREAPKVAAVKRNEGLVGPREESDIREDGTRYWDAPTAPATDEVRQEAMADKGEGVKRRRVPKFATAPETVDTRSDENRVPSETERKQTKGVPTDYTDLAMRNATQDAALDKIDTITPTNAMSKGQQLAEAVWGQFREARAGAYARLEALVGALAMPTYRHGDDVGPVGGPHYAAPLAMILTPAHVARLVETAKDGVAAQHKLDGMRAKVAAALLDEGGLPLHEKVKLARLLTGNEKLPAAGMSRALAPVAAKAEPMPAKQEGVVLTGKSPYLAKDQTKADKATKFIGRGSEASSTAQYAKDFGNKANSGVYTAADRVFVSAEGNREGRVNPDRAELDKAVAAGVTFITDAEADRKRLYNVGERQVAKYLTEKGYTETAPGEWTKAEAIGAKSEAAISAPIAPVKEADAPKQTAWVAGKLAESLGAFTSAIKNFKPEQLLALRDVLSGTPPEGTSKLRWMNARSAVEGRVDEEVTAEHAVAYAKKLVQNEAAPTNAERVKAMAEGRVLNTQTEPAGVQSAENANPSDERIAAAKAYIAKVLGPLVKVQFLKDFDAAGEWVKAENLIKLALNGGPGLMTVAHHEAMHAFFDALVEHNPKAAEVLKNVLGGKDIHERLKGLLAKEPTALEQMEKDPAERVAYAFQFWAAGALDVDKPATTLFAKFRKFLRKVLGMVRESETALDIMTAFHEGKAAGLDSAESPAGRVIKGIMDEATWNEDVKRRFDTVVQGLHSITAPANDVLRKEVMSATAQALGMTMFTNPGEERAGQFKEGYLNARARVGRQFSNRLYQVLKGLSDRDMLVAIEMLQRGQKPEEATYPPVANAVKGIYGLLQRYRTHATEAGLKLENLGDNYFPRIWDLSKLIEGDGKDQFKSMLMGEKYDKKITTMLAVINADRTVPVTKEEFIDAMYRQIVDKGGVDEDGMDAEALHDELILKPFFASAKERNFKWIDAEDVAPFLEKDLVGAMSRYLHQGVRAAEFARRFGDGGKHLKAMLLMKGDMIPGPNGTLMPSEDHGPIAQEILDHLKEKGVEGAEAEKILNTHMDNIKNAVAAHEGSIGGDISPTFRKFSSAAMAYQNMRLLPMALFSAFADISGLAARGPGLKGAYEAFVKGLSDVYARWKDAASDFPTERKNTEWDDIAEAVGAVDSHMFLEQMGKAHTSEFMTNFARNANRKLFMLNGLTAWDRSMRVTATKFAVQFIQAHKSLPDKQHSERWLAELGLTPDDIHLDADGKLIWRRQDLVAQGMSEKDAIAAVEKIHYAITRWVEGGVLSPNAAQRPSWGSDPRWAVLFHLKQFTYSMHHTVMKRAFNEATQGNMNPIGALAAGIPIMMASDLVKGMVQGGGSLPAWQKSLDLGDRMMMATQRAGLAGVGQFGIDALHDPAGLFGPTVGQIAKFAFNPSEFGGNLVDAIPGLRYIKPAKDLVMGAE